VEHEASLPIPAISSISDQVHRQVGDRRVIGVLTAVFGGLALLLAASGLYALLSFLVARRTREFGIRMALGATTGDVAGMVLVHGLRLAAMGLAIGIGGALLLTRLMTKMLFDVKPADPMVFAAVAVALAMVAAAASLAPTLRVTRIRPASALRYE
jgi:ABC-type antimicrobial peptide transport system permease subunit